MPTKQLIIDSILGGESAANYALGKAEVMTSSAIDPAATDAGGRATGMIVPTRVATFSGTELSSGSHTPIWVETTNKDSNTYVYCNTGKWGFYDSTLASFTQISAGLTSGTGNGQKYYNNYVYASTGTTIARYGPLDGVASLTTSYWVSTLSKTALVNTTYPTFALTSGTLALPNHTMHVHTDGKMYISDYVNGQGNIHYIKTKISGGGVEGADDDGSTYNALDLPFGYRPIDMESYGTDLVILAAPSFSTTTGQGDGALFFWDCVSSSFYRQVPVNDAFGTALLNARGIIYVWTSASNKRTTLYRYNGGFDLQEVDSYSFQSASPDHFTHAGGIGRLGNRIAWIAGTQIRALGSPQARIGQGILNIAEYAGSKTTTLGLVRVAEDPTQSVMVGSFAALGTVTSTGATSGSIQVGIYPLGSPFTITQVIIPLSSALANTQTINLTGYFDNGTSSSVMSLTATDYTSARLIVDPSPDWAGQNDVAVSISLQAGTGTTPSILLPIIIEYDIRPL